MHHYAWLAQMSLIQATLGIIGSAVAMSAKTACISTPGTMVSVRLVEQESLRAHRGAQGMLTIALKNCNCCISVTFSGFQKSIRTSNEAFMIVHNTPKFASIDYRIERFNVSNKCNLYLYQVVSYYF